MHPALWLQYKFNFSAEGWVVWKTVTRHKYSARVIRNDVKAFWFITCSPLSTWELALAGGDPESVFRHVMDEETYGLIQQQTLTEHSVWGWTYTSLVSNQIPRMMNWPPTLHISQTGIITLNNASWMELSCSGEADLPLTHFHQESPTSATTDKDFSIPSPHSAPAAVLCPDSPNLHFSCLGPREQG